MSIKLFQPNNLSVTTPLFEPVTDRPELANVLNALQKYYGFNNTFDLRIERYAGVNATSRNYLVTNQDKSYILKYRLGEDVKRRLDQELEITGYLLSHDVKVPQVIKTISSQSSVFQEDGCWSLFHKEEGDYFSGKQNELDYTAEEFAALAKHGAEACKSMPLDDKIEITFEIDKLTELAEQAGKDKRAGSSALYKIYSSNEKIIERSIEIVVNNMARVKTGETLLMHLDFHPLNLIMRGGRLACILDFERLSQRHALAGLGFGGYKLIRQMMIDPMVKENEINNRSLVRRWCEGWKKIFPGSNYNLNDLGIGARYQNLSKIYGILHTWIVLGDDMFNYDFEKQIGSLYEIEIIFPNEASD